MRSGTSALESVWKHSRYHMGGIFALLWASGYSNRRCSPTEARDIVRIRTFRRRDSGEYVKTEDFVSVLRQFRRAAVIAIPPGCLHKPSQSSRSHSTAKTNKLTQAWSSRAGSQKRASLGLDAFHSKRTCASDEWGGSPAGRVKEEQSCWNFLLHL